MLEMNESSRNELTALRARAYGPGADIDSVAAARLSELEETLRAENALSAQAQAPTPDASAEARHAHLDTLGLPPDLAVVRAPMADVPNETFSSEASPSQASVLSAAPAPVEPAVRQPIPRFWLAAWAVSVALVAVVVGGLVFALASAPAVSSAGVRQVATIEETVDSPGWFDSWLGADSKPYRYLGMLVATAPLGMSGSGGQCLVAVAESSYIDDEQAFNGDVYWGCGAGAFPPTVQILVGPKSTEELRAAFPEGAAVQFMLVDGHLVVFTDDGKPRPAPATSA